MVKIRKYANGIERFLHGENGQRFFNFAYSIGAAIVIWGALFKILHLPGGNTLLCIGMGTEIAMFILTAFDRPPKEYSWEDVFPELDHSNHSEHSHEQTTQAKDHRRHIAAGGYAGAGTGYVQHDGDRAALAMQNADTPAEAVGAYMEGIKALAEQMDQLRKTTNELNRVSEVLLDSHKAISDNSENISRSAHGYVEQMADLNRNMAGLNTIYEIQLKSVSGQIETIDRVNRSMKDIRDMYEKSANESIHYCEETEKMARYMRQLNTVYEKMITAMTINMHNPLMGAAAPPAESTPQQ